MPIKFKDFLDLINRPTKLDIYEETSAGEKIQICEAWSNSPGVEPYYERIVVGFNCFDEDFLIVDLETRRF